MNRFDAYITDYLNENKEVALEKIGIVKTTGYSAQDNQAASIEFTCNKKVSTSEGLINYIAEKAAKNKHLVFSDLESHFAQARECINIGKNYEIPQVGFIKANKTGVYEFLPYSEVNKPARISAQPAKQHKRNADRSILQLITFLIVIAILSGLGWQAYHFFSEGKKNNTIQSIANNIDTAEIVPARDTTKPADTTAIVSNKPVSYSPTDSANVRYIYETTASGLRAHTRTAQLQGFGNNAGYDSFVTNNTKFYNLYILKPTKISDTLTVKDSIAKFLQKDIKLQIEPPK